MKNTTIQVKISQEQKDMIQNYILFVRIKDGKKYTLSSFVSQSIMRTITTQAKKNLNGE